MSVERITYLFNQYETGKATDEEKVELFNWFDSPVNKEAVNEFFMQDMQKEPAIGEWNEEEWKPVIAKMLSTQKGKLRTMERNHNWFTIKRVAIAAAILLIILAGYWLLIDRPATGRSDAPVLSHDVKAPDTNRAMVILSNGTKIYLDSAANGQLAMQDNVKLMKLADGKISYEASGNNAAATIQYNTLFNPRGSPATVLTLVDGTLVWLNSASSLNYFTSTGKGERIVEITGECYFEVAHDAARPFVVKDKNTGATVQVLGTHFTISSYADDEAMKVTLLQGSVQVKSAIVNRESAILKPGEQAVLGKDQQLVMNKDADTEKELAWVNGKFIFERDKLPGIMRQLSRWYNVDVVYEGQLPDFHFSGIISRQRNISAVLDMLKGTENIHFRIEGKKIIVTP